MATGTTVFSRVTVVAPRTRIDVALPSDVAVADLMPMLLEMAREATPDGGARHGGWCLAKLGDSPLDPSRTLASLGVVDGDMLQLRKRSENPPPPLYDDVVDAIAESNPDSFRPWTPETARRIGHVAGALALIGSAVAVLLAGPLLGGNGLAAAIAAGVAMIAFVAVGAVLARVYAAPITGLIVAAAGGLPMAFVCGLYVVPGTPGRWSLLLACALVMVVSWACILVVGSGVTVFIAAVTFSTLGALAFLVGALLDTQPIAGIAAGAAAVGLVALSWLPRMTIQLAKLPLPTVPGNAEDLKDDGGFPDYAVIERRAGLAHEFMTGMIIGSGITAAVASVLAATSGTIWGPVFAVVVTLVMLLRSRTYANGSQAVALLTSGIVSSAGVLIGWLVNSDPVGRLLWVFGTLALLGAAALVLGAVFPKQKFSPVLRRSVDIFEAICIAAVVPLALAVMDLYNTLRHLNF
ncbi:type VII secretion integral membrane protein EccD [Kutzneria viridogrisea]|uniref:Type VII secretion integral membrane protein EccD n=1 Tax=Kutzneria viridogrisea TaxID=47990 RepID=A0ABR6BY21_9PSEU|nr:type VII secretion integral membrane protein EccD [Kutzneria albida]MBA8931506.1 type VII secretion integral membrane protein EccD [Kutzneria viridogrisea]